MVFVKRSHMTGATVYRSVAPIEKKGTRADYLECSVHDLERVHHVS